jgi:hypothetical protein
MNLSSGDNPVLWIKLSIETLDPDWSSLRIRFTFEFTLLTTTNGHSSINGSEQEHVTGLHRRARFKQLHLQS